MMSKTIFMLVFLLKVNGFVAEDNINATAKEKYESNNDIINTFMADIWLDSTDMMKVLWKDCTKILIENQPSSLKKENLSPIMQCIKKKTLIALDRSLSSDVIPLGQNMQLVRFERINQAGDVTEKDWKIKKKNTLGNEIVADLEKKEWKYLVLERMAKVFNTHVLKLDIDNNGSKSDEFTEFRHRRRHHMVQMMMFGIMSMGMILVPMGFQFLAVLGGKALLLAKLALILTSIQGLKKVATSPLNYGLYHSPTSFESSNTFEKRGHNQLTPMHLPNNEPITDEWVHKADIEKTFKNTNKNDKIKYRFDSESKAWRLESPKTAKRSSYNIIDGTNVYPVYAVSPGESNFGHAPSQVVSGYSSGAGVPLDTYGSITNPTEIHAEYTIDFPVNKLQLKSSSPIDLA